MGSDRKIDPAVYLKAMELLANSEFPLLPGTSGFSCRAISLAEMHIGSWRDYEHVDLYQATMQVDGQPLQSPNQVKRAAIESGIDPYEFRLMLLAMMAACCEDIA